MNEQASPQSRMNGKVVVVTGAAGGLGQSIARGFADAGASVVLLDRDGERLESFTAESGRLLEGCLAVTADVANEADVARALSIAVDKFGRIDALVNNAGISPVFKRAERLELSDWNRIIEVNLTGTFLCSREAARQMMKQGAGKIVNTSSVLGGVGAHHLAAYCASKGGVVALTKALAADWAQYNIQVNAVAPGYFDSPINAGVMNNKTLSAEILGRVPQKRWGNPAELVGAYLFLASEASSFVTGQTIYVDGGYQAV